MTREQLKRNLNVDVSWWEESCYDEAMIILDKYLDEFENRSCESCSNFNPNIKSSKYAVCAKIGNTTVPHTFCCNRWESNK